MAQQMVGQDACQHRLAHRHRANPDTRVVPALGADLDLLARSVNRAAWGQDRTRRFHRESRHDRLAGGNAAQNAAGVVGLET